MATVWTNLYCWHCSYYPRGLDAIVPPDQRESSRCEKLSTLVYAYDPVTRCGHRGFIDRERVEAARAKLGNRGAKYLPIKVEQIPRINEDTSEQIRKLRQFSEEEINDLKGRAVKATYSKEYWVEIGPAGANFSFEEMRVLVGSKILAPVYYAERLRYKLIIAHRSLVSDKQLETKRPARKTKREEVTLRQDINDVPEQFRVPFARCLDVCAKTNLLGYFSIKKADLPVSLLSEMISAGFLRRNNSGSYIVKKSYLRHYAEVGYDEITKLLETDEAREILALLHEKRVLTDRTRSSFQIPQRTKPQRPRSARIHASTGSRPKGNPKMKAITNPPMRPDIPEHLYLPLYLCLVNTGSGSALNIKRRATKVSDEHMKELSTLGLVKYVTSCSQWVIPSPYSLVVRIYKRGEMTKLDVAKWCGLTEVPEDESTTPDGSDSAPTSAPATSPSGVAHKGQVTYDVHSKPNGETTHNAPVHLVNLILNSGNGWSYITADNSFIIENEHCTITVRPQ